MNHYENNANQAAINYIIGQDWADNKKKNSLINSSLQA